MPGFVSEPNFEDDISIEVEQDDNNDDRIQYEQRNEVDGEAPDSSDEFQDLK